MSVHILVAASVATLLALGAAGCARKRMQTYALIETAKGRITCRLFDDLAPNAVDVFTSFAQGKLTYTDPNQDFKPVTQPLYNGTMFYLVEPDKLIEGGDPGNTGAVGPGVQFTAELTPTLKHDRPGILGMVPSGADKYGSQFYITLDAMPQFDGQRVIFGEVISGIEVATAISEVKAVDGRPVEPVKIDRVLIVRR